MSVLAITGAHVRVTLLSLLRSPGYWVPTLLFPTMLYLFFGMQMAGDDPDRSRIIMVSWCVYAAIGVAFYQFGVGIAQDRESPWETYVRVLPASASVRILARIVCGIAFAAGATLLVVVASTTLTAASVDWAFARRVIPVLVLGCVPFALLGIALGYWTSAKSAVPIANLIYLPLSYAGGLWVPPTRMPDAVAAISPYLPTRRFAELGWAAALDRPIALEHWVWIIGFTLAFGALSLWGYRRDEGARFA